MLDKIKTFNWKRHGNTVYKVLIDFKVIALLFLGGFTVYGIGWETVIKPSLDGLQAKDKIIKEQKEAMEKRQHIQQQYGTLEDKLKDLDVRMMIFRPGTSAKIVSVTEAAELTELTMGKHRASNLPPLPAPHNILENINLKLIDSATIDILNLNGAAASTDAKPADAASPGADASQITSLPVEQYNYDLSVTGTYPALVDLLNQLVASKKLFRINKVIISKPTTAIQEIPDAKEYPDFPVKLDMVVSLSLFLYEDSSSPAPSDAQAPAAAPPAPAPVATGPTTPAPATSTTTLVPISPASPS